MLSLLTMSRVAPLVLCVSIPLITEGGAWKPSVTSSGRESLTKAVCLACASKSLSFAEAEAEPATRAVEGFTR
ncbi:hypothetical protein BCR35DRAFT_113457 [Leucosporidium creatinivorum]|uniref:Secreted protein n=1 Tax=Leucosporidium creatinivorum TaxID=106004 RepID=A0A1Y2F141_9BASI|nr:hypothetical protein BCR35DRAFT_113457 [Leucosporidium creatinivorum]